MKSELGTWTWIKKVCRPSETRKLGLRFDRVATALVDQLRATLEPHVPEGMAVMVTVTAPILLPSTTAAVLEHKIRARLKRASADRDAKLTVHGNGVRIRVLRGVSKTVPKIIGLVHNADREAGLLLNLFATAIDWAEIDWPED